MSDNIVYEISKMMNDESIIKSDLNDAAGLVAEMFKKKYINRLNEKVSEHKNVLSKNPPKEVQLLNALKQFMPEENRKNADRAIDTFITLSTFERLRNEFSGTRETSAASAGAGRDIRPTRDAASPESKPADNLDRDILAAESSVHEDGIYEVDENCLVKKNRTDMTGLIMMMSLLMR